MSYLNSDKLRQVIFLLMLLLLGGILFFELRAFLPAVLGAFTLFILMNRWMRVLVVRGWKPALAASALMLLSFMVIVLPIAGVISMLVNRLKKSGLHLQQAIGAIEKFIQNLEQQIGFQLISEQSLEKLGGLAAQELPLLLGATFNTLTTLIVMYFILYFMLMGGRTSEYNIFQWLPMSKKNQHQLQQQINSLVFSNAIGIPLIAVIQGVIGLGGYLIMGVKEPFLWFAITCIGSMIPIIGAAIAYIPLAIIFFAGGDTLRGVAMLIFGFGVIGTSDNVFRFWLQKKIGDVHPLITVFGVILGIDLFGFIGLVFGPLLISVFILLIRIYHLEFAEVIPAENESFTADESR
ncbi:AI-2E family transporter [Flavihumibacter sp. UBA7668]|uniref:AI-2E family transporter n=1 Tax=Flavihumibacter sp. UBA7668 TaxID=1946542 RepID=UPI0025BCA334|nr:AI-2E family transporter [Flavihumibacter sp. UBA7668]